MLRVALIGVIYGQQIVVAVKIWSEPNFVPIPCAGISKVEDLLLKQERLRYRRRSVFSIVRASTGYSVFKLESLSVIPAGI